MRKKRYTKQKVNYSGFWDILQPLYAQATIGLIGMRVCTGYPGKLVLTV